MERIFITQEELKTIQPKENVVYIDELGNIWIYYDYECDLRIGSLNQTIKYTFKRMNIKHR